MLHEIMICHQKVAESKSLFLLEPQAIHYSSWVKGWIETDREYLIAMELKDLS